MERSVILSIPDDDAEGRATVAAGDVAGADVVEFRVDRLGEDDIRAAVRTCPVPAVVTARARAEGGAWDRGDDERLRLYRVALDAGARAVDVEVRSPLAARIGADGGLEPSRVVASFHGGPCTPLALGERLDELAGSRAARLKLVPTARAVDECDAVRGVLADATRAGLTLACFALGRAGKASRILAPSWGSWATYGARAAGLETAAGQVTVRDLTAVWDVLGIGPSTALYGLVGGDLSASPSPAMHADAFRAVGLDARYLPFDTDDLDAFDRLRARLGVAGVGVTIPHKRAAAARCLALDGAAAAAGAVNTVRFDGPAWVGSNTDASGLERSVRERTDPRGRRAAVVGAGGTGRVAASVLARMGAEVVLINRDPEHGAAAARAVGATFAPWSALGSVRADVWVQATPLGRGDGFRVPADLEGVALVLDFVYADPPTATIAAARALGIPTVDGLDLLAAQGADQFEVLCGAPADEAGMRAVAAAWLAARGGGSAAAAGSG